MQCPLFKIRASAAGKIMGGINRPTEKQMAELARLEAKESRTEKQEQTMTELRAKRDAPATLGAGAKTYCQQWLKEQAAFYNRRMEFSNKYTERGIECEDDSIALTEQVMGYFDLKKNELFFSDDHFTGTPDLLPYPGMVEDVKTSWSFGTFPLFEDELPQSDYYYQLQVYMALTNAHRAAVNYCLVDTPEHFIEREARSIAYKAGLSDVEIELYDEVAAKMTYGNVPARMRFKRFEFDRDEAVIESIRQQVILCRDYIARIWDQFFPPILIASPGEGVTTIERG